MYEKEKLEEIKKLLQEWSDKQSHDRCWYYPDIFNKLTKILNMSPTKSPFLPPRKEFEQGCKKYAEEEYAKNNKNL